MANTPLYESMSNALSNARFYKFGGPVMGRKPTPKQSAIAELKELDKLIAKAQSRRKRLIKQFQFVVIMDDGIKYVVATRKVQKS